MRRFSLNLSVIESAAGPSTFTAVTIYSPLAFSLHVGAVPVSIENIVIVFIDKDVAKLVDLKERCGSIQQRFIMKSSEIKKVKFEVEIVIWSVFIQGGRPVWYPYLSVARSLTPGISSVVMNKALHVSGTAEKIFCDIAGR